MIEENQNTTGSLRDKTRQFLDFQMNARQKQTQDFGMKRAKQQEDLYTAGISATNPDISKRCTKAVKIGQIADGIRDYFARPENGGLDYSNIESVPLVDNYISLNPDRKEQLYDYVLEDSQICDPSQLYIDMGWEAPEVETERDNSELLAGAATAVGVGASPFALDVAGKGLRRGGKELYNLNIDPSIAEATKLQNEGVGIKVAESGLKDAKKALSQAKKSGEGIEDAIQGVADAEKQLVKAKAKKVRTVGDTAMDYNVGGGILEGWTDKSKGIQAKTQANQLWNKTIQPALENSKATVNVQEEIASLADDIVELAKNDPDKLKAYNEALDSLKDSYKDAKYSKYSMKDTQTLKSGLQGRTPQKFWKGKEVTNELQELKGILSTKLKNKVHANLSKELGENSAKLYLDYANLTDYAKTMAKQSTNAGMKGGFGGFTNSLYHKLTDAATQKGGLWLDKGGKLLQQPKSLLSKGAKLLKNIKANPKLLLKGLKVLSPADLIMPDGREMLESLQNDDTLKEWVDKNFGGEITENEWRAILGDEGYSLIDENGNNTLEDKGWTEEGILVLLDSLE